MNRLLDAVRDSVRKQIKEIAEMLNKATDGKLTPNMITITGLLAHFWIAYLITQEDFITSGILLVIFGLFDALDGQLARIQNKSSNAGMVLDAVTDRIKEVTLYTALAYYLANTNQPVLAVWAVVACGASLLVSYIKAKGETALTDSKLSANEKNRVFQDGIFRFEVRMFILVLGLLTGYVAESVMLIAVASSLTAAQRLMVVMRKV